MKIKLITFTLSLFAFIVKAQHPFEIKINKPFFTSQVQIEFATEYMLKQKTGLEFGVTFIKDNNTIEPSKFDTLLTASYTENYKQIAFYLASRFYNKNSSEIGQKGYWGPLLYYAAYTQYQRDKKDYQKPYNIIAGVGLETGYKWLFWKKFVVEPSARFVLLAKYDTIGLNINGRKYTNSSFDFELFINAKLGYRF